LIRSKLIMLGVSRTFMYTRPVFLYIPKGILVALPADTIHAGAWVCFGQKMKYPTQSTKKNAKTVYFQIQHLHSTFCCSKMAEKESK